MSLSSEMEKISTEDECVDSGAETGGSDYSPMSSASSDFSMGELQDPFLVSVHLLSDPGQGKMLQCAANTVLGWLHPELQLFRVSERPSRSSSSSRHHQTHRSANGKRHGLPTTLSSTNHGSSSLCQPALAVILFLQESYGGGGEEQIMALHRALQRPPWRYHHTERLGNGRRMSPLTPCSQDFFTLTPGTPLWAVRQVHYGKEIVRFTVYCRYESFGDMVRLYKLLLRRRLAQRKDDFCFFVVYSNLDTEIQLSFKRLPRGQCPVPTEAAVMEVRVRDVGVLVPLLPNPCTPISELRWQTEDCDGNKILLQVQGAHYIRQITACQGGRLPDASSPVCSPPPNELQAPAPSQFNTLGRGPAPHRNRRINRTLSRSRTQYQESRSRLSQASMTSLPLACEEEEEEEEEEEWAPQRRPESWRTQWANHRSRSLFSLHTPGCHGSSRSACSSPGPAPHCHSHAHSHCPTPPFRVNVDSLIGAEETDVDTGKMVDTSSAMDLTVVSAYNKPRPSSRPSRPVSAPSQGMGPLASSSSCWRVTGKASVLGRPPIPVRTSSLSSCSTSSNQQQSRPHSDCLPMFGPPCLSDTSLNQWESFKGTNGDRNNGHQEVEEDDLEFFI